MKINILVDTSLEIDDKKLSIILNDNSEYFEFQVHITTINNTDNYIIHPETHEELYKQLTEEQKLCNYVFVFTDIPYGNNYFFESYLNLVPVSLFDWDYLTNLPVENGIMYFIIYYLARSLENTEFRHQDNTGCIFDFLGDKKGVDDGMRQAYVCKNCLENLSKKILTEIDQNVLDDLMKMMDLLSTSSKWNKSIFEKINGINLDHQSKRVAINSGVIHVAIASPSDLIEERELLVDKLERKFRLDRHEELCGHRLIVHGWEDLASQTGYAQDLINKHIISKVDIVLAVFKHKLGSPTINPQTKEVRAVSGTAEELLFSMKKENTTKPLGMAYFYSKPPSPPFGAENYDKMKKDWDSLIAFKESISEKVIYKPFTSKEELIEIVSKDLMNNIKELYETKN